MMINTKKTLAEILEQTTTNRELVLYLFERWHDGNDLLDSYWLDENGKKEASTVYGDSTVLEIKTYESHIVIYLKGGEIF